MELLSYGFSTLPEEMSLGRNRNQRVAKAGNVKRGRFGQEFRMRKEVENLQICLITCTVIVPHVPTLIQSD